MNVMLKDKWRVFAIGQFFAGDLENEVEFYNELMTVQNSDDFDAVVEKFDMVVWEPFENMFYRELLQSLENCAMTAQATEARGDK